MSNIFNNLFSLNGKVALVTGGSRGIGEMIASGFAAQGAKVYISSRKVDSCNAAAERISQRFGSPCISIPADLSSQEGITHLVNEFSNHENHLDILVNNAGATWGSPIDEFQEIGWDKIFDTNVKGIFFLSQALLPKLRVAAQDGQPSRIINIGSIDGLHSTSFENYSYSCSKAAVHHLTRVMATRLTKERILCNCIAPGPFPTWMLSAGVGFGGKVDGVDWNEVGKYNPSGRVGSPEDIVGLTTFLSSRAGEFVVGQTIALDGGVVSCS